MKSLNEQGGVPCIAFITIFAPAFAPPLIE